jgi:hypothetical protein
MGMRPLIERLLGFKLPETHDSVQDAKGALFLAGYVGTHGPPSGLSLRELDPQLMIHRIPMGCTEEQLYHMLVTYTMITPSKITAINQINSTPTEPAGKAYVSYVSDKHLDLAFEALPGVARLDKANRQQKRVYLQKGGYVNVLHK